MKARCLLQAVSNGTDTHQSICLRKMSGLSLPLALHLLRLSSNCMSYLYESLLWPVCTRTLQCSWYLATRACCGLLLSSTAAPPMRKMQLETM